MRFFLVIVFFIICSICHSQSTLIGKVINVTNQTLANANIIALPTSNGKNLKFSTANSKGEYSLTLDTNTTYEITVSYIGYHEQKLIFEANSENKIYDFILKPKENKIEEIVIKYEYKPIEIKKDTVTFNVKSFTNGNERKLKEALEKMPGVEVDKNGGVTFQGKKVTQTMVENRNFFGGGSKLAVENIPADALDKIEFIDNFSANGVLKEVSESDQLAMNVKLKKDKLKFVFGDIQGAAEIANDNNFNLVHAGLFYYAPKINVGYIGDINTIGKSTFTYEDVMRFSGGYSSFLNERKSLTNLYSLANDNKDVVKNESQFSAINLDTKVNKVNLTGYSIFSKTFISSHAITKNQYFQNATTIFEDKSDNTFVNNLMNITNVQLDYQPNKNEKWLYNAQYQFSKNNNKIDLNTSTTLSNIFFENLLKSKNNIFKQYAEWHKKIANKHTLTFVINHQFENSTPEKNWKTNEAFLTNFIPIQTDSEYLIYQTKEIENNTIDFLLKHYWILNNANHLYTNIGVSNWQTDLITSENQILTNGNINDFNSGGFGNNLEYNLTNAFFGLEYKFKIKKFLIKPILYLHNYNLKTFQNSKNTISKLLLQPQFNADYEFNENEKASFKYKLVNSFSEANNYVDNYVLQSYNTVFKGNALLENETFHNLSLNYSNRKYFNSFNWFAFLTYNKKTTSIRNQLVIDGINQFSTPVLTDNPENNWRLAGNFSKKIYKINLSFNALLNWFDYLQTVNNELTRYERTNQIFTIKARTQNKKWPDFSIGYTKGFGNLKGVTTSKNFNESFETALNFRFLKDFVFEINYDNYITKNNNNNKTYFEIANSSLRYNKKNSPLTFEIFVNNILNTKIKNNISISDYIISENKTFILPRIVMLSLTYKL
ncbi:carboxypeptidase-like regulatory domain-containing protein [Flavobacterium urocaniciphilum]|uniref:CarboxypepD_reg-like domain-containing protein n=1 Tax=Flavobacterium urocaniciphilum TaxID=1299341 RepID=A0A1H9BM09_9FLAO|nr:carboxypeptidase-like regulatory domain-containing protein [Flavobacterium urocaniciphilum]SEP89787.1 CarboxypepD_reg-like domain-containing protein [Flavobacterium urocaniciphilum]